KSRELERRCFRCTAPSSGEALAALRAPALQDQTAGSRRHAGAEAVPALPAAHVLLVGAFHALERVKSRRSSRGGGQYRRIPRSGVVHSPPAGEKAWKR